MNNRTRIYTLMKGETPDRVPWFGDMAYWYSASLRRGSLSDQYRGDGYYSLPGDYGLGFYLQGYEPFDEIAEGVSTKSEKTGYRTVTTLSSPKGELTEISQYLPISFSSGYVKHFVETAEDLPVFEYYIDSLRYEKKYDATERCKALVGDKGITLCYTPKSPFMQMVTTYSGVENFFYLLADDPVGMNRLLAKIEEKSNIAARFAVDAPTDFIMIPENLSGEVIGERYYVEYLRPYEQFWINEIKKAGKYSFIHMDGSLRGLVGKVAETGFDIIEALTPAPFGNMTIEEADEAVNHRSVIWGGLPGAMLSTRVPMDYFVDHVKHVLGLMRQSPHYVLGLADQFPPDGDLEKLRIVEYLCDEYGRYD